MTSIEETGRTIEEATEKALELLGVTEDEVDVEILEEGAKGFLGLGQSPARVRVTVKQVKAPEPAPKPRPERQRPAPRPRAETPKPRQEEPKPKPQPRPKPAPARPARQERPAPVPAPPVEPVRPVPPAPVETPQPPAPVLTAEQLGSAAEISLEALQRIVASIEESAKCVTKSTADGQVVLEVTSEDPAAMIGKHGQTIDAIQYIVGVITNKRLPEKVRVVVDVEGYRSRREEALRDQALFLASKVKESGEEAVLEPLQANERRIIHTALADHPDVYTYSEGEDPDRHIVISPKK